MNNRKIVRYSEAFKMEVVREVEQSLISVSKVKLKYGITGNGTVERWIRQFGREHLLPRRIKVETMDEIDRIKKLEREKQELESALSQAHLKILCLETLVDETEKHFGVDVKKNYGIKPSKASLKAKKGKKSGR